MSRPNVRERHDDCLVAGFPVDVDDVSKWLKPPLKPDIFAGSAWVVFFSTRLDKLEKWALGRYWRTGSRGRMSKIHVCARLEEEPVYVIASLQFERDLAGWVRAKGSDATQRVPTFRGHHELSRGNSSLNVTIFREEAVFSLKGRVTHCPTEIAFSDFIMNRPLKFLQQTKGLAFARLGNDTEFPLDQARDVEVDDIKAPVLSTDLPNFSFGLPRVFWMPYFRLADSVNSVWHNE